jgi:LPXTG-motif cell wall-anchored protein
MLMILQLDFSVVDVFDIDSYLQNPSNNGTWYQQNTTGSVPKPRVNFCTVVTSAPDNSSHHIYLYAGNDPTIHKNNDPYNNYTSYDDVYVLTIPSFEWTAVYTDGASPRWGHNCHRAGKRQMVTVGGNITNSGDCDWELKGVAFLDLTTVTWGSVFQANSSDYQVAQKLLPATGGTPMGGATKKEPKTGWTDPGLKSVFDTPRKSNSYHAPKSTPTATPAPNPGSHTGAIAGGVVGGVVGLALLAGLLFFLYRRRSKNPAELENHEVQRRELDQEQNKFELPGINENDPAELPGPEVVELNAPRQFVEAGGITTTRAAELSANESGIPQVRTPGDDLPIPPAYTPGLQRPAKARRRSLSPTPRGATTKTPKKSREVQEEGPAFETPRRQSE